MDGSADEQRRTWFRQAILPLEGRLRAYGRRFCRRDPAELEDLVHETFARAIAYEGWRDVVHPFGFAARILKNIALDGQRREAIVAMDPIDDVERLGLADEAPGPEITVLFRDELRRLQTIVATLPTQTRRVFTLRKVYGLSHKQIAERLGLSVSTVEKHLANGLRICSERLAGEADDVSISHLERSWARRQD